MTDTPIEPALHPDEWAFWGRGPYSEEVMRDVLRWSMARGVTFPGLIALANAALPDTDARKITRATVVNLYGLSALIRKMGMAIDADQLEAHAAALESYLPPE